MKQVTSNNQHNGIKEEQTLDQQSAINQLYNLLYAGRISIKEYLQRARSGQQTYTKG